MLAFDDIQHILLTRAPALTGRYEFLSFRDPAGGRAWLTAIMDRVHSAESMRASIDTDKRWVTVAFTWNSLRAWSYPWEANRDVSEIDNHFSIMTEVRRVAWPAYEAPAWDEMHFIQRIAGTLVLFHRSTLEFQRIAGEVTEQPVAVFQRIDQAGYKLPIDDRILADTDTLMVFGLDHLVSDQEAAPEEISAIREWLKREGTCLLIGPPHDVGFTTDMQQRQMEYAHHGDALVPRQQRFGQYTRSLMKALDVPVMNQFGLRPGVVKGTNQIMPLTINRILTNLACSMRSPPSIFIPRQILRKSSFRKSLSELGTRSSTPSFGCHRRSNVPGTFCWQTPQSSRHSSAERKAWRNFGEISPR